MKETVKILMSRDGFTQAEAVGRVALPRRRRRHDRDLPRRLRFIKDPPRRRDPAFDRSNVGAAALSPMLSFVGGVASAGRQAPRAHHATWGG